MDNNIGQNIILGHRLDHIKNSLDDQQILNKTFQVNGKNLFDFEQRKNFLLEQIPFFEIALICGKINSVLVQKIFLDVA